MFDKTKLRGLGGATKKEETRDELLEKVKAERQARNESRNKSKAAVVLQKFWRGFSCRGRLKQTVLDDWLQVYTTVVANPERNLPARQLLEHTIPTLLFVLSPAQANGIPPPLSGQSLAAVKGLLALTMRSVSSQDQANNILLLATDQNKEVAACSPCGFSPGPTSLWQRQCKRLLRLCCRVLSCCDDVLLDTAASRVLELLTDATQWKLKTPGYEEAAAQLLCSLTGCPEALYGAASRCIQQEAAAQPAAGQAKAPAGVVMQRVLGTCARLVSLLVERDASCNRSAEAALCLFDSSVMVTPGLMVKVPPTAQASLSTPDVLVALMRYLQQLSTQSMTFTSAAQPAWLLANLLGLVVGSGRGRAAGTGAAAAIAAAAPLADGDVALGLCRSVVALVNATQRLAPLQPPPRSQQAEETAGAPPDPALAAALKQWWPLSERGTMLTWLSAAEAAGPPGMHAWGSAVAALLPPVAGGRGIAGLGPLNTLAFAPSVLPRLWRWLAFNLGLPLEAVLGASRGLDIDSMANGFAELKPGDAQLLGAFCRIYAHLLQVLDDNDFYTQQQPLTLAQNRAIATSLNTLVFHSYFPRSGAAAAAQSSTGPYSLVAEYAPIVLRALYDRDVRRSFCQAALWLAPWQAMQAAQPPGPAPVGTAGSAEEQRIGGFHAGAVIQTLLSRGEGADEAEAATLAAPQGRGLRPASLSSLLQAAPQCVPFKERVELLRALLDYDKRRGRYNVSVVEGGVPALSINVRRDALMEDGFQALHRQGEALKRRLHVSFVNAAGMAEAGMDQGGLTKEFLEQIVATGLKADYGLFTASTEGLAHPRPGAERVEGGMALLEFLGLMMGKALYEGILLDIAFAPFFVMRLQKRLLLFDDLAGLDPALHRSLLQVKRYEGDVEDLGLTFTVESDFFGSTATEELVPGRGNEPVTAENRLEYCERLANWHLNVRLGCTADAFAHGLSHIIPRTFLRLFNPGEFNDLVSGGKDAEGFDVSDLRKWARYSGGYSESSPPVRLFWSVVEGLNAQERSNVLKFVTSCSRPPLGGFQYLQPAFTIHRVDCDASLLAWVGGKDVDRLPSASTCYNMLKLPNYRRAGTLRTKLLYAINSGAGFELS